MLSRALLVVFVLAPLFSFTQDESDTVFLFDHRMNSVQEEEDARWVSTMRQIEDSTFIVKTAKLGDEGRYKQTIHEQYRILSDEKIQIDRFYKLNEDRLPGDYVIDVDILSHELGLYELDMYSKELNIHKTVYSKTLVPICPVFKTTTYHPNCKVASINFHDQKGDSTWNANGELITEWGFDEDVDEMPKIKGYDFDSFEVGFKRFISSTVKYPSEALNADIDGAVYISCVLTDYGTLEHIEVFRGVHPLIDNASLDVLRKLELSGPAMKDGKPVNIRLFYPFRYNVH